jgi:hypothetical protein
MLAGCYQPASGDPDEAAGTDDRSAADPVSDRPDEPSEATEGADDLPGEIPPALGADGDAGALGSGARQDPGPDLGHAGVTGPAGGTDEQVERRGLTAFVGAESRGQYLTEQVAMCVQCHSPKDDAGRVIPERKFQGAPIPVASPYGARDWAVEAPALAGLEYYDREAFVRLLTEGIARDGEPPQPPMPPFRMSAEDAGAIYDYLSGLPWD